VPSARLSRKDACRVRKNTGTEREVCRLCEMGPNDDGHELKVRKKHRKRGRGASAGGEGTEQGLRFSEGKKKRSCEIAPERTKVAESLSYIWAKRKEFLSPGEEKEGAGLRSEEGRTTWDGSGENWRFLYWGISKHTSELRHTNANVRWGNPTLTTKGEKMICLPGK